MRPKKLLNKINLNKDVKIIVVLDCLGVSKALNSLCTPSMILFHNKDHREGIIQYTKGINNKPRKVESQFKGRLVKDEEGSNTENKFVIIFSLKKYYLKF